MLTVKRKRALIAFYNLQKKLGMPPTVVELADHLGVYPFTIQCFLKALEKEGYITRVPSIARGLRLTKAGEKACKKKD